MYKKQSEKGEGKYMIIAVDTGNKMVKTETAEFHARIEVLDQMRGDGGR